MSQIYPGGIISKTPVTPSGPLPTDTASGVWTLDQAEYWVSQNQWPTIPTVPGQPFAGGYYAGRINISGSVYCLIVSPKAQGQHDLIPFSSDNSVPNGVLSPFDGLANTNYICSLSGSHEAAYFCKNLNISGYTDWYMPSQYEMEVMYYFLKPSLDLNYANGSNGANPYAISPEPVNTAYTTTVPPRTYSTSFMSGGVEAITYPILNNSFWSSTALSAPGFALFSIFTDGSTNYGHQDGLKSVRAIRRVLAA